MCRRIQPLQQRANLGFMYTGEDDPLHFTSDKISQADAMRRVCRVLDTVTEAPLIGGDFRLNKHPREINPTNYWSKPPRPKVVPAAQPNPSLSGGGDGDDGNRTQTAHGSTAMSSPRAASSKTRKRKASSTTGDSSPQPEKRG